MARRSDLAGPRARYQCYGNSELASSQKSPVVDGRVICRHCGKSVAVRNYVLVAHKRKEV